MEDNRRENKTAEREIKEVIKGGRKERMGTKEKERRVAVRRERRKKEMNEERRTKKGRRDALDFYFFN